MKHIIVYILAWIASVSSHFELSFEVNSSTPSQAHPESPRNKRYSNAQLQFTSTKAGCSSQGETPGGAIRYSISLNKFRSRNRRRRSALSALRGLVTPRNRYARIVNAVDLRGEDREMNLCLDDDNGERRIRLGGIVIDAFALCPKSGFLSFSKINYKLYLDTTSFARRV